ncbi:3-dehydroquinate synthase [Flavobacteriaceae bacterium S0825]|uniref:3-dehydroquinate synthase n=1 Tax=Gaetbulibacter sp. S0825 TaxID=2720084 RepID=UPI00142F6121|nr:3-dehydroquinate synthase [Gaetbulibacter sp. S0825]MCK0109693.1 3-dehydroquinate synthase [Flavobacteriaceae bacterium S0825]NIX65325.1 3-dehydroquinate synthase [Gaetbulibacter sp. S0825]
MESIITKDYAIYFNSTCYNKLNTYINESNFSKIFVLVDTNTHKHCLSPFLAKLNTSQNIEIIEIEAGEINKTIDTCVGVWNALSDLDGDRKSLLINLGGGVVTDLGGFVASCFKRGINFINVPTSLLAMVDASIGGKTGVDLGTLKNQIGVINCGDMVLVDTEFLETLPQNEMRSGLAEMLKHGLIQDETYWHKMSDLSKFTLEDLDQLIYESIIIKKNVVTEDPNENGLRKTLNYGHTLGHAIESYCLSNDKKETLLHGEAIAIGMVLATYISHKKCGFPHEKLENIKATIRNIYGLVELTNDDYLAVIELLKFDKKNTHGNINFVLLEDIGKSKIDCKVENALIMEAFDYYKA